MDTFARRAGDALDIETLFAEIRRRQVEDHHGRVLTPFKEAIGEAILKGAVDAQLKAGMRVATAPTGAGKTTSALAVIAAHLIAEKNWTCAILFRTVELADEMYWGLRDLLKVLDRRDLIDEIAIWTREHDAGQREPRFDRDDLRTHRVVFTTHKKWEIEIEKGSNTGVRMWTPKEELEKVRRDSPTRKAFEEAIQERGGDRDLIILDEAPDLVKTIAVSPHELALVRDHGREFIPEDPFTEILEAVTRRAEDMSGPKSKPAPLITRRELEAVREVNWETLLPPTVMGVDRDRLHEQILRVIEFLGTVVDECAFYAGHPPSFIGYRFPVRSEQAHLLLDATADLTAMCLLTGGLRMTTFPEVDYARLQIHPIELPKAFNNVSEVCKDADLGADYGAMIRRVVMENTKPGEKILVVVHKNVLTLKLMPRSPEGQAYFEETTNHKGETIKKRRPLPFLWEDRKLLTLNWGDGIGLNSYDDVTKVFLFGEFHQQRKVVTATVLGYSRMIASEESLQGTSGRHFGSVYGLVYRNHLLRWLKQLACRGSVRNLEEHPEKSGEAICGDMALFTTMNDKMLLGAVKRLFPGAITSKATKYTRALASGEKSKATQGDNLAELLYLDQRLRIEGSEIKRMFGIEPKYIPREIQRNARLAHAVETGAWRWETAKGRGAAPAFVRDHRP